MKLSEKEWKKKLTKEQFNVLREEGTEIPFSSKHNDNFEEGEYYCAGCGAKLFSSDKKFDAGDGWPSFTKAEKDALGKKWDFKIGMPRREVHCKKCGGHLGHVFPHPTKGKKFCINGCALEFKKNKR